MITPETRQYRSFEFRADDNTQTVEGYAAVFENPTVLFKDEGIEYKEIISRDAFAHTLMSDVVMNYDHAGKPVARTKNSTLQLTLDEKGLKIKAELGGTEEGRALYEEIKGGYIDKMSFAFTVADNGDNYDPNTHTRRINVIDRLYDVAAVDIPAYEQTSISARSFFSVETEKERQKVLEKTEREKRKKLAIAEIKIKL